jgi:uncharacterized membrane protein YagU involved in acid resistance
MHARSVDVANRVFEEMVRGAISGFIATLPMTVLMEAVHRRMLRGEHGSSLPPREITGELARRTGADRFLDERGQFALALGAHFAYGAVMGAPYLPLTRPVRVRPLLRGGLYGLALWTASYLGWLPAMQMRGAAGRESAGRNLLMIVAHLLWGTTMAAAAAALREYGENVALRGFGGRP